MISRSAAPLVLAVLVFSQCFPQTTARQPTEPKSEFTSSEKELVESSRKAIIATGLSADYFFTHFKLLSVVDHEADRRVVWQFRVNEHRATVVDAIGYYTQGTQRIATHSVGNALGRTFEISRTLNSATALKKMRSCIGNFEQPAVQYAAVNGLAQLVLTAEAKRLDRVSANERRREPGPELDADKNAAKQKKQTSAADVIESEEEDRPAVILGTINLVTGKCTKGSGVIAR